MHRSLGTYTAVVIAIIVAAAFAVPALAGGKTGPPPSTITLNGTASYGGSASFTVVDPPVKGLPEMSLTCSQNGQQVYADFEMMSGSSPYSPTFTLSSPTWAANGGGGANCDATLFYYTWQGNKETGVVIMATNTFTANG
jgi:hypothetical protein